MHPKDRSGAASEPHVVAVVGAPARLQRVGDLQVVCFILFSPRGESFQLQQCTASSIVF